MVKALTPLGVQRMRPGDKRIVVKDGGCKGLFLTVEPSGLKRWTMRFRQSDGTLLRMTLGPVDISDTETAAEPEIGRPLSLPAARRLASDVNRQRAMGVDFKAAKQRQKSEREARSAKTFALAAQDFVEQHSKRNVRGWVLQARSLGIRPKQEGEGLELIPKGLAERWEARPLADIDGDDVHALVREVRENGIPGLGRKNMGPSDPRARAVFADLSKFFSWCVEERRLKSNPITGVAKPKPPAARDRVLSDREIIWLWKACDQVTEPFGACVKILMLTGARRSEAAEMRRSEFEGSTWTIPAVRSKNHRAHDLPLPPLAMGILEAVPTEGDLVFTTNERTPISGWSKAKIALDEAMQEQAGEGVVIAPWTLHDIRRTVATKLAELGIAPHIVESVLNHVSGFRAGVGGTYNRFAYNAEKKAALERWAAHLQGLVSGRPTNVVPMQHAEA